MFFGIFHKMSLKPIFMCGGLLYIKIIENSNFFPKFGQNFAKNPFPMCWGGYFSSKESKIQVFRKFSTKHRQKSNFHVGGLLFIKIVEDDGGRSEFFQTFFTNYASKSNFYMRKFVLFLSK